MFNKCIIIILNCSGREERFRIVHLFNLASNFSVNAVVDLMEPCRFPVPMGVEQEYIPDHNLWATTRINSKREAKYARLNGWKGEWKTPSNNKLTRVLVPDPLLYSMGPHQNGHSYDQWL